MTMTLLDEHWSNEPVSLCEQQTGKLKTPQQGTSGDESHLRPERQQLSPKQICATTQSQRERRKGTYSYINLPLVSD